MASLSQPVIQNASPQKGNYGSREIVPAQIPKSATVSTPGSLRSILNGDIRPGYAECVKALQAINRDLMVEEAQALYLYLLTPRNESQNRAGENWLRNDIMDKLAQQTALPLGYPDVLVAVYQDHQQDPVMRDYALQYIPSVYERANTEEKTNLCTALWQALGETDSSIAGTSLLALLGISGGSGTDVSFANTVDNGVGASSTSGRAQLAQAAFKLANDDHCGELSRITAVQVCGRMKVEQALSVIEQLAQNAQTMPLRIAATAALGDLGNPAATDILKSLAVNSDPRQVPAAQSALNRLAHTQAASGSSMQAGLGVTR